MKTVEERSVGMTDNEKIVYYIVGHSLASETVNMSYLHSESDLSLEELREAVNGLKRRNLIAQKGKVYETKQ